MKALLILCLTFITLFASKAPQSGQVLVVTSPSWSSPKASLQMYIYAKGQWRPKGKAIKVFVGRKGLAWGKGLHHTPKSARFIKKEGDGKAVAGIFELSHAFGYAPLSTAFPYKVYKRSDHCVDDVHSTFYNKIIQSQKVKKDYQSYEHMKLNNGYYQYGIVVNHNGIAKGEKVQKGAGSCIFMHIKHKATAGCTAMKKNQMRDIIKALNPKVNPLLVQGVKGDTLKLLHSIKAMEW